MFRPSDIAAEVELNNTWIPANAKQLKTWQNKNANGEALNEANAGRNSDGYKIWEDRGDRPFGWRIRRNAEESLRIRASNRVYVRGDDNQWREASDRQAAVYKEAYGVDGSGGIHSVDGKRFKTVVTYAGQGNVTSIEIQRLTPSKGPLREILQPDGGKAGNSPGISSSGSTASLQIGVLLEKMNTHLPLALKELYEHNRKTTHWIWWAFPTTKEGRSEPLPKTSVTYDTAHELLQHAPEVWQPTLERICQLVEENGTGILPAADHGRVEAFITFWFTVEHKPAWFDAVLSRLTTSFLNPQKRRRVDDGPAAAHGGGRMPKDVLDMYAKFQEYKTGMTASRVYVSLLHAAYTDPTKITRVYKGYIATLKTIFGDAWDGWVAHLKFLHPRQFSHGEVSGDGYISGKNQERMLPDELISIITEAIYDKLKRPFQAIFDRTL